MYKRLTILLLTGVVAFALQAPTYATASDIGLGTRVHTLSEQLRYFVCQSQTLADSNADLVVDLHRQIHEQLCADTTEADVRDYLMQRCGDLTLYRPPIGRLTHLLWPSPVLLLMAVVFGTVSSRKQQEPAPSELDTDVQTHLTALLVVSPPEGSHQ